MNLDALISLFILGLICGYVLNSTRVREIAIRAVENEATAVGFQLLDQSIYQVRLSLSRNRNGNWMIWRQYKFSYSYDGSTRLSGYVIMLGSYVDGVLYEEPDRSDFGL